MPLNVAIVYNQPLTGRLAEKEWEEEANIGVLEEVTEVKKALLELGHEVVNIPLVPPLDSAPAILRGIEADVIFNLFEGFEDYPYSEPVVAKMMEDMGLRFTGNTSRTLRMTLNKAGFKKMLRKAGILTPDWVVLTPETLDEFDLRFPCIVKPKDEDASHGLSSANVVNNEEQLAKIVDKVSNRFRGCALAEEFIDGREFNASVIGNQELSLVEISEIMYSLPSGLPRILTYESKWFEGTDYYNGTSVCCPAGIDESIRETITGIVLASAAVAGCRGYGRVDMRQSLDGTIYVLEVNANPDITPELGIALQASARGISYNQLIQKIVDLALE